MPNLTKEEKEWAANKDANTLASANVILGDEKRLNAARKAAVKLAKEAKDSFEGMLRVAGKSNKTVEGMKVLKQNNS